MDDVVVALGATVPLVVGLTWAIWWLVASSCRERRRRQAAVDYARRYQVGAGFMGDPDRPAHLFCGQGEAVTVAELLEEAVEHGEAIRLNWSTGDEAQVRSKHWRGMRPYVQDQVGTDLMRAVGDHRGEWPTGVLPRVENND